jgi:retinol dehydrogenase-12
MAVFSWLNFLRVQFMTLPPLHSVDLSGQTVVVTGSNIGLGLETAKHLARMKPANLILAVRSKAKGDAALAGKFNMSDDIRECNILTRCTEVENETGFTSGKVMILDQGDFASVSAFVTEFEKQYNRLDVLIANAGIGGLQYNASKHGWESMCVLFLCSASCHTFSNILSQDSSQPLVYVLAYIPATSDTC